MTEIHQVEKIYQICITMIFITVNTICSQRKQVSVYIIATITNSLPPLPLLFPLN